MSTPLEEIRNNRRVWYNGMGQATRDFDYLLSLIDTAINSCKDVTILGRFAPAVNPVRWVEQLQAHLETRTTNDEEEPRAWPPNYPP